MYNICIYLSIYLCVTLCVRARVWICMYTCTYVCKFMREKITETAMGANAFHRPCIPPAWPTLYTNHYVQNMHSDEY